MFSDSSCSASDFLLTQIRCDGSIIKYSSVSDHQTQTKKKEFIGHVRRGFFYNNKFYAVGLKNNLIKTDIKTGDSIHLLDFNDMIAGYNLWRVLFVNEKEIVVSAYIYDDSQQPISKQRIYFLFKINQKTLTADNISIPDCRNDFVALYGEKIYYTDNNGDICSYYDQKNIKLGIKGRYPTISQDGLQIAYIEYGEIWSRVCIFDLSNRKRRSIIKFLGNNSVYPLISWSKDGTLLAVSNDSDIFATIIYIVDSKSGKIIKKIKKSYACSWFFE